MNTIDSTTQTIKVVIADDHTLLTSALSNAINSMKPFKVLYTASDGLDLIKKLEQKENEHPDLVLMDIRMSPMGGFETTSYLRKKFPKIKVLALSMNVDDFSLINMFKAGARGYLNKNIALTELKLAMKSVMQTGYYLTQSTGEFFEKGKSPDHRSVLSPKELEFLNYVITDQTYKEIAEKMNVSERTVHGYREGVFKKLKLKNRPALALYCAMHNLI